MQTGLGYNTRFATMPQADIQRSAFDRSHTVKTTMNAGQLIPIALHEILPGDTISMTPTILARMTTLLYPLMDNVFLDAFVFYVPNRIVWEDWAKFLGEKDNPDDTTTYEVPQVESATGGFTRGSLADYYGIPPLAATGLVHSVNALPFRGYNLIWKEWFRVQQLEDSPPIHKDAGPDPIADYTIRNRAKRHDYFTAALPWPQAGDSVQLPLGATAPVTITGSTTTSPKFLDKGGVNNNWYQLQNINAAGQNPVSGTFTAIAPTGNVANDPVFWYDPALVGVADLSLATAATVNQVRTAFQLQRLLERDARGGTRLTEIIRSHFGVESDDGRLQRPEYLGGMTVNMTVNEVSNQGGLVGKIGDLAAYGVGLGQATTITKSFTEHGFVHVLVHVRAPLTYSQGQNRLWDRRDKYDYYWPALAHLGEQAILNKEIYYNQADGDNEDVWGYIPRYEEYRYAESITTNTMRPTHPISLDGWHLGLEFGSRPLLNDTFIKDTPPISRVVAVTTDNHFIIDAHIGLTHVRPMPTHAVPGMIDHF